MKLNATPRHYMPLSQNQSDDDESGPSKEDKTDKQIFKNSFEASEGISKRKRPSSATDSNPRNLPMSPIRLSLFILSLLLCVLFVIVFVFVMPCTMTLNLNRICHVSYKWKKVIENITFSSSLDFVDVGVGKRFLIVGYDGVESGLLAIQESNGKEYWRRPLHSVPTAAFCNEIDVDSDGINECLTIGTKGLLTAIDIRKGSALWYLHNHNDLNDATSINGPVIVPDLDNDKIKDIIISYNVGYGVNSSNLAVVSGGTGQILGSLIELPQCNGAATIHLPVVVDSEAYFVLHCPEDKNNNLWLVSSSNIFNAAMNESNKIILKNSFRIPYYISSVHFYGLELYKNNLIIILDERTFLLLQITPQLTFKRIWETFVESERHVRVLTSGQFVNGSSQLVVVGSESKVIGINLIDGKKMWSSAHENGTVTSGIKLPNFFGNSDGLLLKIISSEVTYDSWQLGESFLNTSDHIYNKNAERNTLEISKKILQESYVLVKCSEMSVTKSISTEEILTTCKVDGMCNPDLYTANVTAVVRKARLSTSLNIFTISSSLLSTPGSEGIIIKHLNLENISSLPRCTG